MPGNVKLLDKTEFLLKQETEFLYEGNKMGRNGAYYRQGDEKSKGWNGKCILG